MKWRELKKTKNRKIKNTDKRGGLEKQKAEQDHLVFSHSTINQQITFKPIYFYKKSNAAIDSS